jgi:hypothetical protein
LDVTNARVSRLGGTGAVLFETDESPWQIRVWVGLVGRRRFLRRIRIDSRDPKLPITAARLARLPVRELLHIAAAQTAPEPGDSYPDEVFYRMLAKPKPTGQREWDDEHWERVLAVYEWAKRVGRKGGGPRAIADFWGIALNPTGFRWLQEARRRAGLPVDSNGRDDYGTGAV